MPATLRPGTSSEDFDEHDPARGRLAVLPNPDCIMVYRLRLALHLRSLRLAWLASLVVLTLQRMPALRVLLGADAGLRVGVGHVLRALVPAAVAASTTAHTLTGATEFMTNPESPVNGTVGVELAVVFAFSGGAATPESYSIVGTLPPGMTVPNATGSAGNLTLNGSNGSIQGTPTQSGSFSVMLTAFDSPNRGLGDNGSSSPFDLQFIIAPAPNVPPSFTQHPQPLTVNYGASATFNVSVSGTPAPTLQWRKDNQPLDGETGVSLVLSAVTLASAGTYDCVATNSAGNATSNGAALTVNPPPAPSLLSQPSPMTSRVGSGAFFSVQASGPELTYQWRKNTANLPGETGPTLFLNNVQAADAAAYSCVVTNPGGNTTSNDAALSVVPSGSARLVNLSARAVVGTGGDILIPGFVISGSGSKRLLVRAVGPRLGLPDFGVPGVLPDPTMTVFAGSAAVHTNDDWVLAPDQAGLAEATNAAGAFSLEGSTKDAAALLDLAVRDYTVQASGVNQGTGVAIIELYDLDNASAPARLVNLSARAVVGTGADILIPGFVIEGDVALTVLVRGAGPTLGLPPFGLNGVLVDPVMTVFRGSEALAVNDNWESAPNQTALTAASSAVGAFDLAPGAADSALLMALSPGAYTVQVVGKNGGAGVAIVEVYVVGP